MEANVAKVDEELGLVFGWALVCKQNGREYFDTQGDHIPESTMLKASAEFMVNSRAAGDMHAGQAGQIVFAFPLTEDIAKSLNLETRTTGLMIAAKFDDPAILQKFKDKTYTGFSIGGRGVRREVTE